MTDRYVDCGTLYDGMGNGTVRDGRIVIDDGRVRDAGPADYIPGLYSPNSSRMASQISPVVA